VSAEESMRPELAAWDWDLRPLAGGGAAVPTVPSGGALSPHSSLIAEAIRAAHAEGGFDDEGIVSEMLSGINDDVKGPRGTFLCAPHSGALRFYSEARSRLQANVDGGWAVEHDALPFWPLRCDPYSVVDESSRAGKPKFRLTNDHSWPPPGGVTADGTFLQSLNATMDRSGWPEGKLLRVREMAEAAAILQSAGVPVRAGVLDVVAYYKQFGRQLAELHRNGALTEHGVMIEDRCCFGSAADASKCCRASNFLVFHGRRAMQAVDDAYPPRDPAVLEWLAEREALGVTLGCSEDELREVWTCLHAVGMYVDDASHVSIDDELYDVHGVPWMRDGVQVRRADAHFEALRASIMSFGLETAKEQPPCLRVELLGVEIDLELRRMRLTDGKRAKYEELASEMAGSKTCELHAYISLLGKLNFAATCYPRGRQWMHAAWRAARARFRTRSAA